MPLLAGLVKVDLKRHWSIGNKVFLEQYLAGSKILAELGTPETVAAVEALYASTPFTGVPAKVKRAAELLADVDLAPLIA